MKQQTATTLRSDPARVEVLQRALERERDRLRGASERDRADLARPLEDKGEDTSPSQHPADVAFDLYSREETLVSERSEERALVEVEAALARIAAGAYGTCVDCGREIPLERLDARPEAARCVGCERAYDKPHPRR